MTEFDLGRIIPIDKGEWNDTYSTDAGSGYEKFDIVTSGSGSYLSLVANNTAPLTARASWFPYVDGASIDALVVALNTADGRVTQVEADIVQLAGEVSLLDAVQGAKIKDIENVISTMNPNQSAQLSVSGRKVVSLPKNASNGGMSVKLEGLTAENLVGNGDFRNGITGWSLYQSGATLAIEGDYMTYISNDQAQAITQTGKSFATGDKLYVYAVMKVDETSAVLTAGIALNLVGTVLLPSVTVGVTDTVVRGIITAQSNLTSIVFGRADALNKKVYLKKGARVINLTQIFGTGNEPDLATCDAMFSDYFDGVKSFVPTGRIRSVGKNVFNSALEVGSLNDISGLPESIAGNGVRSKKFTGIIPNTQYSLSNNLGYLNLAYWYDSNENYIARTISPPYISPINAAYMKIRTSTAGTQNDLTVKFQLEKSSTATPYEPYRDTKLYLTAPELRSNGTVKDEIRKGVNGYELVKRVGVGTLGSELVTNGGFDTDTWWTKGADWSIANGVASKSNPASTTDLSSPSIITANTWYVVTFEVKNYVSGSIYSVFSGNALATSPYANSNGIKTHLIFSGNAFTSMVIRGQSFVGSVDNISVKKLTMQDDAPLNISIPRVYGGMANCTLAETRIIPISHGGILNSAENGTVYHEPIIADAGVYGTDIPIFNTDYPIASIEEIIKHEGGVDTYLNASTAVIAPDGLSFTHPDLASGDLVLFTYAFDKESTNGNITATFYDSNVVEIDTVTGKAYKITDVVTNGVLTRTLTEV